MHSNTRQPLLHVLDTLHFYKAWKILKLKKKKTLKLLWKTLRLTHSNHTHKHAHIDTLKGRRSRKHNQNVHCSSNEEDKGIKLKFLSPQVFLSIVRFSFPLQGGVMGRFIYICGSVLLDHSEGRPPGLRGKQSFLSHALSPSAWLWESVHLSIRVQSQNISGSVTLRRSHCCERPPVQSLTLGTWLSSSDALSKHWLLFTCTRLSFCRSKQKSIII